MDSEEIGKHVEVERNVNEIRYSELKWLPFVTIKQLLSKHQKKKKKHEPFIILTYAFKKRMHVIQKQSHALRKESTNNSAKMVFKVSSSLLKPT